MLDGVVLKRLRDAFVGADGSGDRARARERSTKVGAKIYGLRNARSYGRSLRDGLANAAGNGFAERVGYGLAGR